MLRIILVWLTFLCAVSGTAGGKSPIPSGTLRIGDLAPNFTAPTQNGPLNLHEWAKGSWVVMMSHPKSFTPVCSTELATAALFQEQFAQRGAKLLALSIDTLADQKKWIDEINTTLPHKIRFPMIADDSQAVSLKYGMIDQATDGDLKSLSTIRSVFIIGPDRHIKIKMEYPATTGRSFPEIIRALDALQAAESKKLVTPADWQPGDNMLLPAGADLAAAKKKYGAKVQRRLDYLWTVAPDVNEGH